MTCFELAAFVLMFAAMLSRRLLPRSAPWLLAGAALALAAALFVNPARWQLYPAVAGVVLLALTLPRPGRFGGKSMLVGASLAFAAAVLAQAFAMPRLPAPTGGYAVGTVAYTIERPVGEGGRRLFLKLWYPARDSEGEPEGLWNDLSRMTDIPWWVRWGLAYLRHAPTHSHPGAAYAGDVPPRAVLYNHSFVSWASENSLLAEELASRGNVVVALRHLGQVDEYRRLDRRDTALAAIEMSRRRTEDSRFVVARLPEVLRAVPGIADDPPSSYAAMGFSLGGAVSTQLCAGDPKCRAAVNIDGAVPGVDYARLPVPHFLMIHGAAHGGGARAQGGYEELVLPRAVHADFQDSAIVVPATRWFFGRSVGELALERQRLSGKIADFLDRAWR